MKKVNKPHKIEKVLPGWSPIERPGMEVSPEFVWESIRKQIKHRMRELGYHSLEPFAQDSGISKGALGWLLSGKRKPQIDTLWRMVRALGWVDLPSIWDLPDPLPDDWEQL